MPIYICYHPIDKLFAADLAAQLRNAGFELTSYALQCNAIDTMSLTKSDTIIAVLRPEFVKAPAYVHLAEQFTTSRVIPLLSSPISITDWAENAMINTVVEFTTDNKAQFALGIQKLISILSQIEVPKATNKTHLEQYTNWLEAKLQRVQFAWDLLEITNYGCASSYSNPIQTLLSEMKFSAISDLDKGLHLDASDLANTYNLEQIVQRNQSTIVICAYSDGQLVASFMADKARKLYISSDNKPALPVMLDVETWNEEIPWDEWLVAQLGDKEYQIDTETTISLTIYVYGFEYAEMTAKTFANKFKAWWKSNSPAPPLIMVDPTAELPRKNLYDVELAIKAAEFNWAQFMVILSKYSNRPFVQYVLNCEKCDTYPQLKYLLQNPIFAMSLTSVSYPLDVDFSSLSIANYYSYLIGNLWRLGNYHSNTNLSFDTALSKIAAIVTERQKSQISYIKTLEYIQSEAHLTECIESGLLLLSEKNVRFSTKVFRDYFAAIALDQYGIPSNLPHLMLTKDSSRVPQRWDTSIITLVHLTKRPAEHLRTIADVDPLLAMQCFASGVRLSDSSTYSYVINKNMDALAEIGDFRTCFAKLLYGLDPNAANAIFVEVLRNAQWPIRLYAYSTFLELGHSIMTGLAESLSEINENTRTKISHAVKRIGSNSLATLFKMLNSDAVKTRLNAIWAIKELNDTASVPALVQVLQDSNTSVVIQAAAALATLNDVCATPYLVECLKHRHVGVRKAATNALLKIQSKEPGSFSQIVKQLAPLSRRLVIEALSKFQTEDVFDLLLSFSYEDDVDVKIEALEGLAKYSNPDAVSRLEEGLADMSKSRLSKSSVNEIVTKLLSNMPGYEERSTTSSQIVKARLINAKEQRLTTQTNGHNGDSENKLEQFPLGADSTRSSEDIYVAGILAQLRGRKWDTSSNAAKTLRDYVKGLRGNTSLKVINQILETLNDNDWVIRWTGVETLGWVGNVHVVPHLIQRLADSNWKVRIAAIRALVEIKDNNAAIAIAKLVSDANSLVREAAAEALGYLDGAQVISALEAAAADTEEFVRLAAVQSLGKINMDIATRYLLTALKDSSEHVRWAAANGLSRNPDPTLVSALIPSLSDSAGPYWEQKRICDVIVDILKQINNDEAKLAVEQWQASHD
ncbi:MAG: hypothetical protein GC179_02770 [Anaerolineaceae bacterium]|nr:hypothetical protein [Anaerolineaceae bacterium]